DDHHRRAPPEAPPDASQHVDDPVAVAGDRGLRGAGGAGADFELAAVLEPEQLVRVAMLLAVVDQAGIRRRGDDAVEGAVEVELARVAMDHRGAASARTERGEGFDALQGVERVAAQERRCALRGPADTPMLVAPVFA